MLKPTTLLLGDKANQLLKELAQENDMASRYFFTKIIIREARAEAASLAGDKLKDRLALIDAVNDELVEIINNPPKEQLADKDFKTDPRSLYAKIWEAHKRLANKGWSDADIHDYCLIRYGMDYNISKTPTKSPKRNKEWVGGGKAAGKIKQARKISVEFMDE